MTDPAFPDALPAQTRLHWYAIERVLGQGGFGITYLARDTNLDQPVAIKEYLPVEVATRMPDATIRARTEQLRDRYRWGLERFIQEARTLARFDHRNIVRVHSVFEVNGTAYMVMRFESGGTLAALLDRRGTLPEDELLRIILPVVDGLEFVHNAGFIHRDITPDNIHIGTDGTPVLLDFGSARQAVGSSHTLTILVAPGYAPFEQYYSDSASQGPWTDIYGLGATCYRAIAGRPPLDAVSRSKGILGSTQDVMVSAAIVGAGRYSGRVLAAIDHALAFSEKDRPQSVDEWRRELLGEPVAAAAATGQSPPNSTPVSPPAAAAPAMTAVPTAPSAIAAGAITPAAPATKSSSPSGARRSASPGRGVGAWVIAGALLAAIGGGGYTISQWNAETRTKIGNLEAQIEEKERAAQRAEATRAQAERLARQQAEEEARRRQDQEREARVAQEKAQAELARKRDADARAQQDEQKRRESIAAVRAPATRTQPAAAAASGTSPGTAASTAATAAPAARTGAPASAQAGAPDTGAAAAAAPSPAAEPSPALAAVPAPPAAPEPERKPAPAPTPAEQLAIADRAIASGRDADAITALRPLADTGLAQAQVRLGDLYADGKGVARDAAMAESWYEKAALQGDTAAQLKLGAMYANAGGIARNNNLAYVWYGTAIRLGSSAAKAERDRIGALLQPAEREQADKLIESKVARMPKRP